MMLVGSDQVIRMMRLRLTMVLTRLYVRLMLLAVAKS